MDPSLIPSAPAGIKALPTVWLILGASLLYTAAMVGMKLWGAISPAAAAGVIALAIAGAAWCEIGALRNERLGMVHVAILAAETLCVAAVAHFGFDERFTQRALAARR